MESSLETEFYIVSSRFFTVNGSGGLSDIGCFVFTNKLQKGETIKDLQL